MSFSTSAPYITVAYVIVLIVFAVRHKILAAENKMLKARLKAEVDTVRQQSEKIHTSHESSKRDLTEKITKLQNRLNAKDEEHRNKIGSLNAEIQSLGTDIESLKSEKARQQSMYDNECEENKRNIELIKTLNNNKSNLETIARALSTQRQQAIDIIRQIKLIADSAPEVWPDPNTVK